MYIADYHSAEYASDFGSMGQRNDCCADCRRFEHLHRQRNRSSIFGIYEWRDLFERCDVPRQRGGIYLNWRTSKLMNLVYDPFDWYWIIGSDESQVYSSKRVKLVGLSDVEFMSWNSDNDRNVSKADTMNDLVTILRLANVPPYHRIPKSIIVSRLTDQQLTSAISLMTVRQQERWRAPDWPMINADDPEMTMIIDAIGADPEIVLAPVDSG